MFRSVRRLTVSFALLTLAVTPLAGCAPSASSSLGENASQTTQPARESCVASCGQEMDLWIDALRLCFTNKTGYETLRFQIQQGALDDSFKPQTGQQSVARNQTSCGILGSPGVEDRLSGISAEVWLGDDMTDPGFFYIDGQIDNGDKYAVINDSGHIDLTQGSTVYMASGPWRLDVKWVPYPKYFRVGIDGDSTQYFTFDVVVY